MKKIVIAVMSTISGLVLLFSYHTSTNSKAATTTAPDEPGSETEPTATASPTPNSGAATSTPSASAGAPASGSGTFTGDAVDTRWGPVQVRIVVKDGRITSAEAVEYPTQNPRDQQINAYAIPQLNADVVAAQSANIDAVSGATVTSDGYLSSLQSTIDQANLN